MAALSQVHGVGAIIGVAGMAGLTAELYRPASSALIADVTTPSQRVVAYAVYRLAVNAGYALGPITAGFIAQRSFTLVFLGDAATSLVLGCCRSRFSPAAPRH